MCRSFNSVHLEVTRGSPQSLHDYHSKANSRDEIDDWSYTQGDPPHQGKRKDIDELMEVFVEDERPTKVAKILRVLPQQVQRFPKFVRLLQTEQLKQFHYTEPPLFYVLHGPTGSGKTRFAYDLAWSYFKEIPFSAIPGQPSRPWFDGYDGQSLALLDEYTSESLTVYNLKRLTDRYILNVEIKGSTVPWFPRIIVLCSNISPDSGESFFQSAYPGLSVPDDNALLRRLTLAVDTSIDGWQLLLLPLPRDVSKIVQRR